MIDPVGLKNQADGGPYRFFENSLFDTKPLSVFNIVIKSVSYRNSFIKMVMMFLKKLPKTRFLIL